MIKYRLTREASYLHNCEGRLNKQAREGYYKSASSELDARRQMCEDFPEDNGWFTVDEEDVLDSAGKVAARIMGMPRSELEAFYFNAVSLLFSTGPDDEAWNHEQEWAPYIICSNIAHAIHDDIHDIIDEATPKDTDNA